MTTDSDPRGAVIHKVIGFGGPNASLDPYGLAPKEFPSKQLLEDPFANVIGYGTTVRQPPYSMEQMVILAEAHPIHAACIEQKVADIVASGPVFVPREEGQDSGANADEKKEMEEWWEALSEDLTSLEIVNAIWSDYETVGWGCMEIARDKVGEVRRIYHVPAHTVRAHVSGRLFVQIRQGRTVVFKAYGEEGDWYSTSVRRAPKGTDPDRLANELLVFRKPSRRSTWYGIPVYISAIGNITLAIAARDFNVLFFSNNREPRNLIILTGMAEDVDEVASSLTQQLAEQHKEPFHNMILPIEGDAKVQVERMMLQQNDMHFCLGDDTEILTADGWVTRPQLTANQTEFATFDIHTGAIEYQRASAITDRHFEEMLHFESSCVDLVVSSEHSMVYRNNSRNGEAASSWRKAPASEFVAGRKHCEFPAAGLLDGEDVGISEDEAELAGWIISEGHFLSNCAAIQISQNEGERADRIRLLLKRLDVPHRESMRVTHPGKEHVTFYLNASSASRRFRALLGSEKRIPTVMQRAPIEVRQALYGALMDGDGTRLGSHTQMYTTSDEVLADQVQQLAIGLGYRTHKGVKRNETGGAFYINAIDRPYASWSRDSGKTISTNGRKRATVTQIPYGRNAWCPTVPNGTIVVRRSGKAVVVGNSKLMDATDEAILTAHRIPPDRLGIARRGFLGGSVANVTNRIYKDGVVARGQDILEDRLGRFITNEFALHKKVKPETIKWKIDLEQLDVSDESIDISNTVALVKNELITLNEGRGRIGLPRKDEFEDFTLGEFMQSKGISPAAKSILDSTFDMALTQRTNTPVTPEQHAILTALDDLNGYIEEMLGDEDDGFSRNGHAPALAT